MLRGVLLVAALNCVLPGRALAQAPFRFERYSLGFGSLTVESIYQDARGFVWIASDQGLYRHDGYDYELCGSAPGGPIQEVGHVNSVMEDSRGQMWAATANGLARVDGARLVHTVLPSAHLPPDQRPYFVAREVDRLSTVYEAPSEPGVFWLSNSAGLARWDGSRDTLTFWPEDQTGETGPYCRWVLGTLEDSDGNLWVSTCFGLDLLDRTTETFQRVTDAAMGGEAVQDPLREDVLWLPEQEGLSRLNRTTGIRTRVIDYREIAGCFEDCVPGPAKGQPGWTKYWSWWKAAAWDVGSPGVLWVAGGVFGLFRYDTVSGEIMRISASAGPDSEDPILGPFPVALHVDEAGVIWVGDQFDGLWRADPQAIRVRSIRISDRLGEEVSAILEAAGGRWMLGAQLGGGVESVLIRMEPDMGGRQDWKLWAIQDGEARITVNALAEDRHGRIWIALTDAASRTTGELYRLDSEESPVVPFRQVTPDSLRIPHSDYVSLYVDRSGIIWAGTSGHGVLRIDPDTDRVTRFSLDDAEQIVIWHEDTFGRLWAGSDSGLCRFDRSTGQCTMYPVPGESVHANRQPDAGLIIDIAERASEAGVLWLATPTGVYRFESDSGRMSRPSSFGVLGRIRLASLVNAGPYLVGAIEYPDPTMGSVFRYDPDRGEAWPVSAEGIGFQTRAGLVSRTGDLVFGTGGLRLFDGESIEGNRTPPRVHVTGISVNDRSLPWPRAPGMIRLPYHENNVAVSYVGLHFSNPEQNRYAFRLDGLHGEWQEVGNTRRAVFDRLPPGEYTFHVRAANADGAWNTERASLSFVILPPWWGTTWAYLAYGIILVAGIVAWDRRRQRRIREAERRRGALIEAQLHAEAAERDAVRAREHVERMQELDEAKNRLFANLSHEFRTPLTVILGPIDAWFERGDTEALTGQLEPIRRNARRLLDLITQLLDLSRLEAGSLALHPEPIDLAAQIQTLVSAFHPLAERRGVALSIDCDVDELLGMFDPDSVEKVVSNLLSNALKFTDRGGKVHVGLAMDGHQVVIQVSDTGIGIPADRLEAVFERFHRVDESGAGIAQGTGIGLSLVRELVHLMGGTVTAESREGFGSTFSVRFPLEAVEPGARLASPDPGAAPELLPGNGMPAGEPTGRGPLILVADDHPDIRAYVAGHLASDHRVAQAEDGTSALRLAKKETPDLVIADVMMPGLDGFALCRALRDDETLRTVPVILLTARAEEEDRIRGLEAGADDYLTKPFSVRELEVRVANLMLSRRSLREAFSKTIRVLPEEIDVKSRDESFVEQVLALMNRRIGDSAFGTDMLADEIGLSRRQVERRVKEALGRTPPDLLREMRLERAAQILKARPGSVAEVARAVGFRSASHFAAAFRRTYGVSPSEFADSDRRSLST